jgi:hypothetical protein
MATRMKKVTQEQKDRIIGGTITKIRPLTKAERAKYPILKSRPKTAQVIMLNNGEELFADALILVGSTWGPFIKLKK